MPGRATVATLVCGGRCGFTLIEVMVVVALTTIVAALAITVLAAVKQWDRRLRDHDQANAQVLRLADTIRTDIRGSESVLQPTADTLVAQLGAGRKVRYVLDGDECRRMAEGAGEAAVDRFAIGPASSWKLVRGEPGRRPQIVIELERSAAAGEAEARYVPLLVCGVLGADRAVRPATADSE